MAARKLTLLTHSLIRDHSWSLHSPGCPGIHRDGAKHGSVVDPDVVIDLDDEDAMMRALDVDGLGYTSMDVRVHACCGSAPLAPAADPAVEPGGLDLDRVVPLGEALADAEQRRQARRAGRLPALDAHPEVIRP